MLAKTYGTLNGITCINEKQSFTTSNEHNMFHVPAMIHFSKISSKELLNRDISSQSSKPDNQQQNFEKRLKTTARGRSKQ